MSFSPFLDAPLIIQLHVGAALLAILIGPIALYRPQRDRVHKTIGYVWFLAMACVAVSAFFIHSFPVVGPFSPLHLFAILTLWSLWSALVHVRAGRIAAHRATLRSLYWHGLTIAGLFTFLPGRVTNRMLFDERPELGWVVIGLGAPLLAADAVRRRRRLETIA